MKKFLALSLLLLSATAVFAQYPQLTDEAKQLIGKQKAAWAAHSDSGQ